MSATWYIWVSVSVLVPESCSSNMWLHVGTWVHEKSMSSKYWVLLQISLHMCLQSAHGAMLWGKSDELLDVCQGTWKYTNISGGLRAAPGNLAMPPEVLSMPMEICQCTSCTWKFANAYGNFCCSWKLVNPPGSQSVPLENETPCKFYVLGSLTKALEVLTTPESLLMLLKVRQCLLKSTNVPGSPLLPWTSANIPGILLLPWKSANVPGSPLLPRKSADDPGSWLLPWKSANVLSSSLLSWKSANVLGMAAAALGVC